MKILARPTFTPPASRQCSATERLGCLPQDELKQSDVVSIEQRVAANRISTALHLTGIGAAMTAGAYGAASLLGSSAFTAGAAAVAGAAGALVLACKFLERSKEDVGSPLRQLAVRTSESLNKVQQNPSAGWGEVETAVAPTLTPSERQQFTAKLQPGDILLNCSGNSLFFVAVAKLFGNRTDFTHAMVYEGNGQVLHSTGARGSHRSALDDTLANSSRVVAVRPAYAEGEAGQVVDEARNLLGRGYDWVPSLDDKRLGCAEMAYHALMRGAPSSHMQLYKTMGYSYPSPRDFLTLNDAETVAEAGHKKTFVGQLNTVFRAL